MPEPAAPDRPCPRCQGTGACVDCQGTGQAPCPVCRGTGARAARLGQPAPPCRTCGGTGTVRCPSECPSCGGTGTIQERFQAELRARYTMPVEDTAPTQRVVRVLLFVNVALYLATLPDLSTRLLPQPIPYLLWHLLGNHPASLQAGEYWRFLTPAFLHATWWHLALNMYMLHLLGPALEGVYGARRFLTLYLGSALLGNTLSWLAHPGLGVGASSALYGMVAATYALHRRWGLFHGPAVQSMAMWFGGMLLIGLILSTAVRLDNFAHLGGALFGLAYGWLGARPRGR